MAKTQRKHLKEIIDIYLVQHPAATLREIGGFLGTSKQRAQVLLRSTGRATRRQKKSISLLTTYETQILYLLASGDSTKEIAIKFKVSEDTIQNQVNVILSKLDANNRIHAVVLALQKGLLSLKAIKSSPPTPE